MAHRYRVLLLVSVATFVASLDLFIVNIAFPGIQRDFGGTGDATLSWVLNAYAIVSAALLVPFGRIADLVGRKRVFLIGMVVFVAASALCAAAQGAPWLIAARVLQAAGGAALLPTSLALLLPEFPPRQRPLAVAVWSATGAIAAAAGPPIGGLLVQASWRWVFLVNLPVGLVTTVLAAARCARRATLPGGIFPTWSARCSWSPGSAAWRWPSSRARPGAGAGRASSGCWWAPRCCSAPSCGDRRAIPCR
ncbi:MAG TPA: MFS transporter [Candidatus Dormibacteraeota bacterium]|jgi:MFS family permease|nr:MFS transporter [Candidatus Dormibacteraeota bacterium]